MWIGERKLEVWSKVSVKLGILSRECGLCGVMRTDECGVYIGDCGVKSDESLEWGV